MCWIRLRKVPALLVSFYAMLTYSILPFALLYPISKGLKTTADDVDIEAHNVSL